MHTLATTTNPNGDCEVLPRPVESLSQIAWHPSAQYMVASSWDNTVRCWKLSRGEGGFTSTAKAFISHSAPALACCFNHDGTRVFSGGCDNQVISWDLMANQSSVACQHLGPVKFVHWIAERSLLMTGSWDETLMYFDPRTNAQPTVVPLKERVYCADVKDDLAVVACSDSEVFIFDLKKPSTPLNNFKSPLKLQSRSVSCFIDKKGFALGSIEGRVAISHVDPADAGQNFAFKCHREGNNIFAINDIDFHPKYGTFATVGSDGTFNFWDKDTKQRVKAFKKASLPISCCKFSPTGNLFAYSVCYDWSHGSAGAPQSQESRILIHDVLDIEVRSRRRG